MYKSIFILLIVSLLSCSCANENSKNKEKSSLEVLNRVLGEQANRFELSLSEDDENDWFEIQVNNNNIHIKGNSDIALCKGAYHYIIDNGYGVITWEGNNVNIPKKVSDESYGRVSSLLPLRMYLNPVTYGYTTVWWDWERWEKEIDWMAMHGINMPIALLGQEYVWKKVWEEIGIDGSKLDDYYCGPAFLPWFRMGNIYNHQGGLPQNWILHEKELQKKILNRMKALGMKPITPAFSGHVPPYFKELYPDSKTYDLKNWSGFENEKASVLLDPKDSLFSTIGQIFLSEYEKEYGKSELFLADSFNEMFPPVSEENKNTELAEYGAAIYRSIKQHDAGAQWVVQGWTFGHQEEFWTPESTKYFFSKIPKNNLLILNYGEDQYPIWEKLEAFYGFKWTYGYVHNYGGQQSLFGDINFYHDGFLNLLNSSKKQNLVGYGCLPEALENNSIVYEYIFDAPWGGVSQSVEDWIKQYLTNRYGKLTPNVEKAWDIALKNTYSTRVWKYQEIGLGTYIHNNRPSLSINETMLQGNVETVLQVLINLLSDIDKYEHTELFMYDIIDFAQHYSAYLADVSLIKTVNHYKKKEYDKMESEFEKAKVFLLTLEQLQLGTDGNFTTWCEQAVALAKTDEERTLYLQNAKSQVTIWGGETLKDYASKSWSGIISDFYIPRWELLFSEMKQRRNSFDEDKITEKIKNWEQSWGENNTIPQSPKQLSNEETIGLIRTVLLDVEKKVN